MLPWWANEDEAPLVADWAPCSTGPCCDPYATNPPQYCPGQIACQTCGGATGCQCPGGPSPSPTPTPTPTPTPSPAPTPGSPPSNGCFRDVGNYGAPLLSQKDLASGSWQYQWGPAPYGHQSDVAGVLQIVNGGSDTMWIRYGGNGINPGETYDWKKFITTPSKLNGNKAHAWTALNEHGMVGQGHGFKLEPGEYQIVPFSSSSCWAGATLGCDQYGANCAVSPNGRGAGTDASPSGQPNTLFEWTAPGVWDASLVDGFGMPMKVEVDGCGPPGTGQASDCGIHDSIIYLELNPDQCPNKITNGNGHYVGCKSMCGCQNSAEQQKKDTDAACGGMAAVSSIVNKPHVPGGYCGCPQSDCVDWLRNLFDSDHAGGAYCNAITAMTKNSIGNRAVYCQAYDDKAGTRSYGNGIMKVTFCNKGFEWVGAARNSTRPAPATRVMI